MKLSDFLSDVGRPVAFYPSLVKAFGDRNEAIFICQMSYWRGKGEDKNGWIYKSVEEIESETSLTYKEQTNVRNGLKEKALLQEKYARSEHKLYFRVDWDKVNETWEQFTNGKVVLDQREGGSLPEVSSLNSNTENTQEITQGDEEKILLDERIGLDWAIAGGKKIAQKQLFKQSEMKAFEDMLDAQFRRLRLNFSAFDEKAKEAFRRFIRNQHKDQTLERFVSWWLEDEWRAANPPYTLAVIMQRWLQAFENSRNTSPGEYRPRISA